MRWIQAASLVVPVLLSGATDPQDAQDAAPSPRPTLSLRQAGSADVVGSDDRAIQAALGRLQSGGTLVLGPGRYVVRQPIYLPMDLVLRGEEGALLALPAPVLTAQPAAAGSSELALASPGEFLAPTRIQIAPPVGSEFFADGETRSLELRKLVRVEGARLGLAEPFPFEIPAGSRVSYANKLLLTTKEGRATIENLAFDGGRLPEIPLQGHWQRCAIWAAAPFGYEEERLSPPGRDVVVRHCRFSNWYGRAIALYNMTDCLIEGCVVEHVADEAIDLDHFCERVHVVGNDVQDATWGIVLNDASRSLIEYNRISGCDIGIYNWWFEKTPRQRINEENVIRHNVIRGPRQAAIHVGRTCERNLIELNFFEGEIVVEEPTNTVRDNTRL